MKLLYLLLIQQIFLTTSCMQMVIIPEKKKGLEQKIPSIIDSTKTLKEQLTTLKLNKTHPFGLTWVYKIDLQKNISFKRLGRLSGYDLSKDMNDIEDGNWVFTRYHTLEKTVFSNEPMRIGAIIIGTRHAGYANALAWAYANQHIKTHH